MMVRTSNIFRLVLVCCWRRRIILDFGSVTKSQGLKSSLPRLSLPHCDEGPTAEKTESSKVPSPKARGSSEYSSTSFADCRDFRLPSCYRLISSSFIIIFPILLKHTEVCHEHWNRLCLRLNGLRMHLRFNCLRMYLRFNGLRMYLRLNGLRMYLRFNCLRMYLRFNGLRMDLRFNCLRMYLRFHGLRMYLRFHGLRMYLRFNGLRSLFEDVPGI